MLSSKHSALAVLLLLEVLSGALASRARLDLEADAGKAPSKLASGNLPRRSLPRVKGGKDERRPQLSNRSRDNRSLAAVRRGLHEMSRASSFFDRLARILIPRHARQEQTAPRSSLLSLFRGHKCEEPSVKKDFARLHISVKELKRGKKHAYVHCENEPAMSQKVSCSRSECEGATWCFVENHCGNIFKNPCKKLPDAALHCSAVDDKDDNGRRPPSPLTDATPEEDGGLTPGTPRGGNSPRRRGWGGEGLESRAGAERGYAAPSALAVLFAAVAAVAAAASP